MGLEKADRVAHGKGDSLPLECQRKYGFRHARSIRKISRPRRPPENQNGLTITNTTMIATAKPGTSFSNRNCLPDSDRSPRASFFAYADM